MGKYFFVLKTKIEKNIYFFHREKKLNEKSPTFSYNLPDESYEKSPVMKMDFIFVNTVSALCNKRY